MLEKPTILFLARNAGLKDQAALAAKAKISEARLEEVLSGSEITFSEAYRLSLALEISLYRIARMALNLGFVQAEHYEDWEIKLLSGENPEHLLSSFTNQRIVEFNGDLYLSSIGKIEARIPDYFLPKISDTLMRQGNVKTVRAHKALVKNLPFHSLKDLDAYGEDTKEKFLFFSVPKEFAFGDIALPYYFPFVMNRLLEEEAKEVLQELDRRVSNIASFVKDALEKGGKLKLWGTAYLRFETDEGHAFIYSSCFPDLAFEDESMNHIRAIEKELRDLAAKD